MEMLGARSTAAPKAAGQWGELKSGSVQRALHEALAEDHFLSQVKVVEIPSSTLNYGTVSTSELADLQIAAEKSKKYHAAIEGDAGVICQRSKIEDHRNRPVQVGLIGAYLCRQSRLRLPQLTWSRILAEPRSE
jgi:hypothetical protein